MTTSFRNCKCGPGSIETVGQRSAAVRGNRWELTLAKPFLKPGTFHLQQIQPSSLVRFDVRLGTLTADELKKVKQTLVQLLKL